MSKKWIILGFALSALGLALDAAQGVIGKKQQEAMIQEQVQKALASKNA